MTQDQMQASIARHSRFLTPDQHAALMPSEAELLARDRASNAAKNSGLHDRLQAHFALRMELREVRA